MNKILFVPICLAAAVPLVGCNQQISSNAAVTADPAFEVTTYNVDKVQAGNTLFPDNHDPEHTRIVEINREGGVVWEYVLPADLKRFTNPGWDVEPLESGNILTVLPGKGVYEINRAKEIVWKYESVKVSHDADRLANGNTLIAFGNEDTSADAQVTEINSAGEIIWQWKAGERLDDSYSRTQNEQGWTHTNSVTRLDNGHTLVSLRNFNRVIEVDPEGYIVQTVGEDLFNAQHDPLVLSDGTWWLVNHGRPNEVLHYNPDSGEVLWKLPIREQKSTPARDANVLENGNILITAADRIIEMTPDKEKVWELVIKGADFTKETAPALGFYKAERIAAN